ncbi:MAG: sigma 54-interacting transcriptional regulator [Myxococcota bacterium]|nr:sigma 54-interacting transcriptional regulator [Myxococcota bacterium]
MPSVEPGIVMVARGTQAVAMRLPVDVALGRRVVADGKSFDVDDDRMSRDHATVRFDKGAWVITDLASRNGTFVNGLRITGEVRRQGNTVLRLGHTICVLLADASGHPADGDGTVGPEFARAFAAVRHAGSQPALLLQGEAGADHELAARLYHDASPRRAGPLVTVACSSMPDGVAERLLFGAQKGVIQSIGHFQMAQGGTIVLDDIAALQLAAQSRLLRLLERRQLEPLGVQVGIPIDVGVVATAHLELRLAVAERRFDDGLYRRLATTIVKLPPLRDRKVDVARIVQREVVAMGSQLAAHARLVEACLVRPWPGNVRELIAAVRDAANRALANDCDVVRPEDLDDSAGMTTGALGPATAVNRKPTVAAALDKATIEVALARAKNVITVAARALGVHRSELYQLMDQHGIVFTDDT